MPKAKTFCYEYPRPAVTVDVVVFALRDRTVHVLLIRRGNSPFAGRWAVPGGFLELEEPVEHAALRELREETGLAATWPLEPIGFFGEVGRDPRGRTISLAFATVLQAPAPEPSASDDASEAAWYPVAHARDLAFDHGEILDTALLWLRARVEAGQVGLAMLPERFTVDDARGLLGGVLGVEAAGANWLKRLLRGGAVATAGARGWYQRSERSFRRDARPRNGRGEGRPLES